MPMINDITTLVAQGQEKKPIEHKQTLDAADFQRLFLEQMTHQDPLAPMEQKDMMAQLAQLMELSRNNETNEILKSMKGMEQVRSRVESAALLGKQVLADASKFELKDRTGDIYYRLPTETTGQVAVDVMKNGKHVQTFGFNAGAKMTDEERAVTRTMLQKGIHTIRWDGTLADGSRVPDGTYDVVVRAVDTNGLPIRDAGAAVTGFVKRVGLSGDNVTYKVGTTPGLEDSAESYSVKPEQIYQILPN